MEIKLENFLHDLIWRVKEEYNACLEAVANASGDREKAFADGQSLAYYHFMEMIANQLSAFGDTSDKFENLVPEPGEKAELK